MVLIRTSSILTLLFLILLRSGNAQNLKESLSNKVNNLVAFSKLYGHIKYFHPSDEAAAINWDKFAIYGVQKVKEVQNQDELKAALDSLFLPIAPTLKISRKKISATSFISSYLERLDRDTSRLKTVAWQHLGVDLRNENTDYSSIRINKPQNDFLSLRQVLDPQKITGKQLKLRVALKAAFESKESEASVSIEQKNNRSKSTKSEYYSNSSSSTDKQAFGTDGWEIVEVKTDINKALAGAVIDITFRGPGTLWIDGVTISAKAENGEWELIPLANPGFEKEYLQANYSDSLPGWILITGSKRGSEIKKAKTYSLSPVLGDRYSEGRVIDNISFTGKRSYQIKLPAQLFDEYPSVGETTIQEIAPGLYSEVPLALYSDGTYTLPRSDEKALEQLKTQLRDIDLNTRTASDVNIRLANVIIVWNIFQHFYPYFDAIDTNWQQQLIQTLQEALTDRTTDEFYGTLSRMLASLQDGHIFLTHASQFKPAGLPFIVDWIDGKVVVTHSVYNEIRPGDIVQSLDGLPAGEWIQAQTELLSGSPQLTLFRSLELFRLGKPNTEAIVEVEHKGQISTYTVPRSDSVSYDEMERSDLPVLGEIEEGIFYVDLDRASMNQIEDKLEKIAGAEGVIFDLRGYANYNHQIISHLLTSPDTSKQWIQVPRYIYPDQRKPLGYRKSGWHLLPSEPHIEGKVVFLTDERTISYAEGLLSFIKHYNLGEIIGQPTGGVNGYVNSVSLPGGYRFYRTGSKVVKHDDTRHHLIGIQPTVHVSKTIEGVREGRDEFLDKAIEILK